MSRHLPCRLSVLVPAWCSRQKWRCFFQVVLLFKKITEWKSTGKKIFFSFLHTEKLKEQASPPAADPTIWNPAPSGSAAGQAMYFLATDICLSHRRYLDPVLEMVYHGCMPLVPSSRFGGDHCLPHYPETGVLPKWDCRTNSKPTWHQ